LLFSILQETLVLKLVVLTAIVSFLEVGSAQLVKNKSIKKEKLI
jgi:hypothetical protein